MPTNEDAIVPVECKPKAPIKRIVGRPARGIPDEILHDKQLAAAIAQLPSNYNFEIRKTIWRLREAKARRVALQFPEGLLLYACTIADIVERFVPCEETVVMGDVTYGACCVDDLTASAVGADFLVHYGHSCLVPVTCTSLKALYVFVEISIDPGPLVQTLTENLAAGLRLCVMGTVQFISGVHATAEALRATGHFAHVHVPQAKPLSSGEVLGCTAPRLEASEYDALVFVADGRFHLEAAMIANPELMAYRYNPYDRTLSRERYDLGKMMSIRSEAVEAGRRARRWGVVFGTLGRQGNPALLKRVTSVLESRERNYFVLLLSELTPQKLALMCSEVECWVQIACPRLSIDWGHFFDKPVLTPYELEVALELAEWQSVYPMDYYAKGSGTWTNMHPENVKRQLQPPQLNGTHGGMPKAVVQVATEV